MKTKMKTYLCKEGRETFTIKAKNLKQAQEDCLIWNAVVIQEVGDNKDSRSTRRLQN